jgi:hypothetical protein
LNARNALLLFVAMAAPLAGCTLQAQGPAVEYVWTRTPGVVFVVVRPSMEVGKTYPVVNDGSGNTVDPRSAYLVMCDARRSDGMHCDLATEASIKRLSYTPSTAASAPALDVPVGSIVDFTEKHTYDTTATASTPPQAPPPPPPPPQAPAPPTGAKK